jgi:alanine racemase
LTNERLANAGTEEAAAPEIWPVLKADAYGHGAPAIARTLERAGAPRLCVALLEEAIELRQAGIRVPIVVMGGYYGRNHLGLESAIEHDLTPVIYHAEQIATLARIAHHRSALRVGVHLKVDSGMARLGVVPSDLATVLEALRQAPILKLEGLMSHLACADGDDDGPNRLQLKRVHDARDVVRRAGFQPAHVHVGNSAALLRIPESRFDAVRPGIAVYGIAPSTNIPEITLLPAMRIRSEIVAQRTIAVGEHVGYGFRFRAERTTTIATIPMGYADGLSRGLSNQGEVLIRGKRAPIAGIVSMDLTAVDVTDIAGAQLGDEVVFLGTQDAEVITPGEIASRVGTISWEVMTNISRRVPRFYRDP